MSTFTFQRMMHKCPFPWNMAFSFHRTMHNLTETSTLPTNRCLSKVYLPYSTIQGLMYIDVLIELGMFERWSGKGTNALRANLGIKRNL